MFWKVFKATTYAVLALGILAVLCFVAFVLLVTYVNGGFK
jgi:hypothetical protein